MAYQISMYTMQLQQIHKEKNIYLIDQSSAEYHNIGPYLIMSFGIPMQTIYRSSQHPSQSIVRQSNSKWIPDNREI